MRGTDRSRGRAALLAAALTAACAARGPAQAPVSGGMPTRTASSPGLLACEEQVEAVQDGLVRLADRYLWEEVDRLLQIYVVARRDPDFAAEGARCEATTRDALAAVAQRWAEQGAETGGAQSHDLARRAFRHLRELFPASAEAPRLRHAMGRLEWVRAERVSVEIGERTLADDGYRQAHAHHRAALAGGLPPELTAVSAREQLEAIRRVHDGESRGWDMAKETCVPDPRGRCPEPQPRAAPTEPTAADAEWLSAYDTFLAEPSLQGTPEAIAVATERAALLMLYRRWDAAEPALRAIAGPGRAEARRLLLGLLVARWMEAVGAGERAAARLALIDAASAIDGADGEIGALATSLRRAALWAQALETQASSDHLACGAAFEGLYGELGDPQERAEAASGAGNCYARAGAIQKAITWLEKVADEHREVEKIALDAVIALARLHERILNDESARDRYLDFLARAPREDRRLVEARRRSLALSLRAGTLPEAQVEAMIRGRPEDRRLAAAIRFRAACKPGAEPAAIEAYIERFGKDGGSRRLAIAHAGAAEALLRASCPVDVAEGLCAQIGRDRMPARVVPREPKLLARARAHLERAQRLLPTAIEEGPDTQEILLAVTPEEVQATSRRVALLLGDLDAESALATRPPASLDPVRSRAWLDLRKVEVERMSAVYEKASGEAGGRDAAAAIVETRKAAVYESDLALLEEVAAAVERAGDAGLAAQMRALAAERREAVFQAYSRCLDAIAGWGHDPAGQASLCRAGLGRLVGRYEEPLEYAPDADGRVAPIR